MWMLFVGRLWVTQLMSPKSLQYRYLQCAYKFPRFWWKNPMHRLASMYLFLEFLLYYLGKKTQYKWMLMNTVVIEIAHFMTNILDLQYLLKLISWWLALYSCILKVSLFPDFLAFRLLKVWLYDLRYTVDPNNCVIELQQWPET